MRLWWWISFKWFLLGLKVQRNRRFVDGWRASIVRRFGVNGFVYYPATGEQKDNVKMWWLWMVKEED